MTTPPNPASHPPPATLANLLAQPSPARSYLFVGLSALTVLTVAQVLDASGDPVAVAPALVGAVGLLLRWTSTPIIVLIMLVYFLMFPSGEPINPGRSDIPRSQFRLKDMIYVAMAGIYFLAHYRLLSLTTRAVPADAVGRTRSKRRPVVRSSDGPFEREAGRGALVLLAATLLGQIAWYVINVFAIDLQRFPPIRLIPDLIGSRRIPWPPLLSTPLHRLLVMIFLMAVVGGLIWFVTWYWRLLRLNRDEARMIVLDAGWREGRRELNRQAKWRSWGLGHALRPSFFSEARDWLQWVLWLVLAVLLIVLIGMAVSYYQLSKI